MSVWGSVVGGMLLAVVGGWLGGAATARLLSRWRSRWAARLAALAVPGALVIGGVSALTVVLELAWAPAIPTRDVRESVAAMSATAIGEVGLLAWMVAWGVDLGLRSASWRTWITVPFVGIGGVAASVAWSFALHALGSGPPEQPEMGFLADGREALARSLALAFVLAFAPVAEELLFRGALHGALERRWGARVAVGVGAVTFGVLHGADPLVVPALAVFGWLLGLLRVRSGSAVPGMLAHALNNSFALMALLQR